MIRQPCTVCARMLGTGAPTCRRCGRGPVCDRCHRDAGGDSCPMVGGPCEHWFCSTCLYERQKACFEYLTPMRMFMFVEPLCPTCDEPHAFYDKDGRIVFAHRQWGKPEERRALVVTQTFLLCNTYLHNALPFELVEQCLEFLTPLPPPYDVVASSMFYNGWAQCRAFDRQLRLTLRGGHTMSGVVELRRMREHEQQNMPIGHHQKHIELMRFGSIPNVHMNDKDLEVLRVAAGLLRMCTSSVADVIYLFRDDVAVMSLGLSREYYLLHVYKQASRLVPRLLDGLARFDCAYTRLHVSGYAALCSTVHVPPEVDEQCDLCN